MEASRIARNIGVVATLGIWLLALALVMTGTIHPLWFYPLIALGIGPYLLSIKIIEPLLERKTSGKTPSQRDDA